MNNQDDDDAFMADFEREQSQRPLTNVELVVRMMEHSRHGALAQAFIMEALGKWSNIIAKADPKEVDTPFMAGELWVEIAKDIKRQLDERK